jgi:hypothetical protein
MRWLVLTLAPCGAGIDINEQVEYSVECKVAELGSSGHDGLDSRGCARNHAQAPLRLQRQQRHWRLPQRLQLA